MRPASDDTSQLNFFTPTAYETEQLVEFQNSLILADNFPFEQLSRIALPESFRKEVYRPIYHLHKWWAQRLGSVFRGIIIASHIDREADFLNSFYSSNNFLRTRVFDPFMGSGTTLGEAYKLGCTALGRDINPVAFHSVRVSLSKLDEHKLRDAFNLVEKAVSEQLKSYYKGLDSEGNLCDVLYYFWVKYIACPSCGSETELFSNYIFSKHAYVKKFPRVQTTCPRCHNVIEANYDDTKVDCNVCAHTFNPHFGVVNGAKTTCQSCGTTFSVSKLSRERKQPPSSKMYAKLILGRDGKKKYLPIDKFDLDLYSQVASKIDNIKGKIPDLTITPGHNTNQVLNYGYQRWNQFFNERQLVSLFDLLEAIAAIDDKESREVLCLLFSAVLEFNNNFNSFKGEGTGAVRHLFSHHVLKPERTPIEANLWGTPFSSGSFSTLFRSRILRAAEYQKNPFELVVGESNTKKYDINKSFAGVVDTTWPPKNLAAGIYASCGSSDSTGLAPKSIDLIITDPPFFDNVHYSELADFFYSWNSIIYGSESSGTTRSVHEVQDADASAFSKKLQNVFKECHRVVKDDGLLIFSYHHSRKDGWTSVAKAVMDAGFSFVQAHPVKAEMSVATPKLKAKSPIDYDIILVCQKVESDSRSFVDVQHALSTVRKEVANKIERLRKANLGLSHNDILIITNGALLKHLSPGRNSDQLIADFGSCMLAIDEFITQFGNTIMN